VARVFLPPHELMYVLHIQPFYHIYICINKESTYEILVKIICVTAKKDTGFKAKINLFGKILFLKSPIENKCLFRTISLK